MKFYLLTIFAITTLLVLMAVALSANAQEKGEPRSLGPGPIKSPSFSPLAFLRANTSRSIEFSISGNITEGGAFNTSSSITFDISGNATGPAFRPFPFPFPLPFSVDSDDDVSPRVQDEDVKAPLVREPHGAFFDS